MASGNASGSTGDPALGSLPAARSGLSIGALFSPSAGHSLADSRRLVRPWLHLSLLVAAMFGARLASIPVAYRPSLIAWLMVPFVLGLLAVRGSYRRCIQLDPAGDLLQVVAATSLAAIAVLALEELAVPGGHAGALVIRAWILSTLLLWVCVLVLTIAERHLRRAGTASIPTLLVGAGKVGALIERRLRDEPELGLNVVGYVDAGPGSAIDPSELEAPILGIPDDLTGVIARTGARHVIFTFTNAPDGALIPLIRACEERGVQVSLVPRMFERVNRRASLESIGRLPLFSLGHVDPKGWEFAVKHTFDRAFSCILLVIASPLFLAVALAVKVSSPGPTMFRQRRVGRDGRHFEMLKFRSMRMAEQRPDRDWLDQGLAPGGVEGEDRRTAVGCFIRRYSLDELPQLLNVLRGEMSLIGPRPERPEFVEVFDEQVRGYADRHRVKSGITGLAQTNGLRGQTSLTDRIELDNYYIQHWSMTLDLKILLATIGAVLRRAE
jgi:exopolysaccharide biosynthesis polyprenyl glycosylphosphotransferase